MPDRRHRTDLLLPRERQSTDDNNPFAPPPEGRPDQPWHPRRPANDGSSDDSSSSSSGSSDPSGSSGDRSGWGSQWSSRQPGRSSGGGFGGRPGGQNGQNGQNGGGGQKGPDGGSGGGLKWDPTDPAQRRARYALLSGMWAFFFALFDFPEVALLLGALALYWSISSLRAKPQRRPAANVTSATPPPMPTTPPSSGKPQITAAVTGLVMASIALVIVAGSFTAQLVYRDYYTCVNDALTKTGQLSCNELLPDPLRGVIGVKE
ncbi:hypothetical protein OG883_02790 [Streptomyces sp. NBC_01142]|uniref:hypothetical protein n=1 Tax=Streptomyces sp. NBC_01142 TaxID=2975865 RepID=UPI00224FE99C|nr:hypothetical protein [Streptomyces sp. NBC_01142]MCX4818845.1 hypothetical protein [Streptomyces sp. NBC_01142]